MATNWIVKFRTCLLISAYKALKDKDGVTAGFCSSTEPHIECSLRENQEYSYAKSNLISRSKTDTADLCLEKCQVLFMITSRMRKYIVDRKLMDVWLLTG